VHGSVVVEIEWVLEAALWPEFRDDHPEIGALYERSPELLERARTFWADDNQVNDMGFLELTALAVYGELLQTMDADALVADLAAICTALPDDLRFPSESEVNQDVVRSRLRRLQESPELRARYLALVHDVWEAARPAWERVGRAAVEAAVAARRARLLEGASWLEVSHNDCECWNLLPPLATDMDEDGLVAVVPAYYAHLGLVFAAGDVVIAGVRVDLSGAEARARVELTARRLKTVADPTRLAILGVLASRPRTVTELALAFDLAQPTVSNHVKLLRDAGLVKRVRRGTRMDLIVERDAVTQLIEHLESVFVPAGSQADGFRRT
jgi:DNA-binding transcriptional ArsR family regulator